MKYCPICQKSYTDETLNFCLEDGSHLVTDEFISNSPTLLHQPFLSEMNSGRHSLGQIPSIAILPFINVSADAENEYFCDRLAKKLLMPRRKSKI